MTPLDPREDSDTTVAPARTRVAAETPTLRADPRAAAFGKVPSWVIAYLVFCGVLTVVGLVILGLERQMLDPGPR